jgi:hypothetical protein
MGRGEWMVPLAVRPASGFPAMAGLITTYLLLGAVVFPPLVGSCLVGMHADPSGGPLDAPKIPGPLF